MRYAKSDESHKLLDVNFAVFNLLLLESLRLWAP